MGVRREAALRVPERHVARYAEAARGFRVDESVCPAAELARLESFLPEFERDRRTEAQRNGSDAPIARTNFDVAEKAKYWLQMTRTIASREPQDLIFRDVGNSRLFQSSVLRCVRDDYLRACSRSGRLVDGAAIRTRLLRETEDRHRRALSSASAAAAKLKKEFQLGTFDPADSERYVIGCRDIQRRIRLERRGGDAQLSALRDPATATTSDALGTISTDPDRVSQILFDYGSAQNGASTCVRPAADALLRAVVPEWPTLQMPDGSDWTLRGAISFEVFVHLLRQVKRGKAAALHPFLVEHLSILEVSHPIVSQYYELLGSIIYTIYLCNHL